MKRAVFMIGLLAVSSLAAAKDHHASLAVQVIQAKTVFVPNEDVGNELQKWGHYRIVDDPKDADLIFQVTTNPETTNGFSYPFEVLHVRVLDAKTGAIYWAEGVRYGFMQRDLISKSATRKMIKDFCKRVDKETSKIATTLSPL